MTPSGNLEPENNVEKKPASDLPTIIKPDSGREDDGQKDGSLVEQQQENTQQHVEKGNEEKVDNPDRQAKIFADSAEEEWLALNLVNGETDISLEAFPELQNAQELEDTFYKVYYQNPYVLGLSRFSYDYAAMAMHVEYFYGKEEIRERQREMTEESRKIVSEIIKEGMDTQEKEKAVYDYLTEHCTYDHDALEDARKNNFKKTENNRFEDSFNGYGILVRKKGVCQSYAYAYKLLCEMSGVSCRVMTGNLDGSLPHAWNVVEIGKKWYQTDATNNEKTTGVPYFLYDADNAVAEAVGFSADKNFELDEELEQYDTEDSGYEYYNKNHLVAESMEQYEEILDGELEKGKNTVSIRYLPENINKKKLISVVSKVYNKHGMEEKLNTLRCSIKSRYIILQA